MSGAGFGDVGFGTLAFGSTAPGGVASTGGSTGPTQTESLQPTSGGGAAALGSVPTTISLLTGDQFAARIAALFPRGWVSDDAKQPGGATYALFLSLSNQIAFVQAELQYAAKAQRIQTETSPELDYASVDFLGTTFPRPAGATDASFAAGILATLFQPAATRSALQNALANLTGYVPRMLEPWSVTDTGAWGANSYWNVDTVGNPARWGDGGLRYQGFIETAPPSIPAIGVGNPILTWNDGAYWNVPGYFFGIIEAIDLNSIDETINKLRAYGTIVWVKLVTPNALVTQVTSVPPGIVPSITIISVGTDRVSLSWSVPLTGTTPFQFQVLYRITGTVQFQSTPGLTTTTATITGLLSNTSYDFEIVCSNAGGSSTSTITTTSTNEVPPGPATNLNATLVQATAVTLSWVAPVVGSPPFTYTILYRVTGTTIFDSFLVGQGSTTVTVIGLLPDTEYDFEVQTSNL